MGFFRVPKFTQYALRSLSCLAQSGRRMSVREIGECERIHPASLAKTLHALCCQGLVHSKRGRRGGFWLARPPEEIVLRQVAEIFQGSSEADEEGFSEAWESLYAPTRAVLEKMTLADLLRLRERVPVKASAAREGAA